MPDLYIPPPGFYFRLLGYESNHVLHSRTSKEPEVWHHPVEWEWEDQYFELIHGPANGNRAGLYAIRGKVTGKVLFSRRSPNPRIGHVEGGGNWDDNWFTFEVGTGTFSTFFRIVCPNTSTTWVSRTNVSEPEVFNHPSTGVKYPDQYFSFLFEDTVIDRVVYHVDQGEILNSTPMVIATQTIDNGSDAPQTSEASINVTTSETSSLQFSQGLAIKVGTSFQAGIPFIVEGRISVEITSTTTFTWGSTTTTSKSYTARFPVTAPPRSVVRATSSVTQSELDIPVTIYSRSISTGVVVITEGKYYGVTTWDLRHNITQSPN